MSFSVEDTRKKAAPTVKELVRAGVVTLADVKDWLRTIYEIRFFEEKVYDLLGQNIIKGASHLYAGQEAVAPSRGTRGAGSVGGWWQGVGQCATPGLAERSSRWARHSKAAATCRVSRRQRPGARRRSRPRSWRSPRVR